MCIIKNCIYNLITIIVIIWLASRISSNVWWYHKWLRFRNNQKYHIFEIDILFCFRKIALHFDLINSTGRKEVNTIAAIQSQNLLIYLGFFSKINVTLSRKMLLPIPIISIQF